MKIKQCEKFQIRRQGGCQCMGQFPGTIRVYSIFYIDNQWYGTFYKEGPDSWNKTRKLCENFALRAIHCYKSTNAYHLENIEEGFYEFVMIERTKKERVNVQEEVQS